MGIDLGTQSVRVIVLDNHGTVLAATSRPLNSTRTIDRHEQDPQQWWDATRACLLEATAQIPATYLVRALAVSGTSGTIIPTDRRTGMPVGMAVMYDDRRGAPHLERVLDAGAEVWDRLGYRMQATWALPKIMTLVEEGAFVDGEMVAHQPDIITSRLAGRTASDLSSALKTGADLDTITWPAGVFQDLELPLTAFGSLARSGDVIGHVTIQAAHDTGLPAGCAVVAGMTDGCAAQIAAGALTPGAWNSVLGTTLVIKGAATTRITDTTGAIYAHRAPFDLGWYPGGASSTGAGVIPELLPDADLTTLTTQIAPDLAPIAYPLSGHGERFPFTSLTAAGFYPHDAKSSAEMLSAIFHGVAYIERLSYDLIRHVGYPTAGPLTFTGGGTRNPYWNQLRVNLLGRPASIPTMSEGAAGMAILAAAAVSDATHSANRLEDVAQRMIHRSVQLNPDPTAHQRLSDAYLGFLDEMELRGWVPLELLDSAREGASTP